MTAPKISIVVPIYNGAQYLPETLESLLRQSFSDFELLAIDDGSTDHSAEVVRSYGDRRIRLIQKPNSGLCEALNCGIAEARAQWIARSDQDDVSFPERLERQLAVMREFPDASALFAYNTKVGGRHSWSNTDKLTVQQGAVRTYEPLVDGCLLGSTMFARVDALKAVGGYRQAYYPVDDWDLECRMAERGRVLVLCEAVLAYRFQAGANTYRVFSEMQTKSRWTGDSHARRLQGLPEQTFAEFLATEPSSPLIRLDQRRLEQAKWYMRTAGQCYLDGRYFAAASRLSAALLFDPGDLLKRTFRMFRNHQAA